MPLHYLGLSQYNADGERCLWHGGWHKCQSNSVWSAEAPNRRLPGLCIGVLEGCVWTLVFIILSLSWGSWNKYDGYNLDRIRYNQQYYYTLLLHKMDVSRTKLFNIICKILPAHCIYYYEAFLSKIYTPEEWIIYCYCYSSCFASWIYSTTNPCNKSTMALFILTNQIAFSRRTKNCTAFHG